MVLYSVGFVFLVFCSHKKISPNYRTVIPKEDATDWGQCERSFPNPKIHFGGQVQYNLQCSLAAISLILSITGNVES